MSQTVLTKAKSRNSRLNNQIIKHLYFGRCLSCFELSELLKKSIPLVTKGINDLIKKGFVVDKGYAPSSGGRKPLLYSLKSDKMFMLCVSMDQLFTSITIVDLFNNQVKDPLIIELKLMDNPDALSFLIKNLQDYIKKSGISLNKIIGAGIGMPGFINTTEGVNYTYLNIEGINLEEHLTTSLGIPTYIDNDSSLIALAELRFGMARYKKEVMVINVGWGIGLGMILNGELFRGHNGFAGEFSHIPISEDGKLCSCGKLGCLEAEASLLAVGEKAIEAIKQGQLSSLQDLISDNHLNAGNAIIEAAIKGDQYAIELLSDAGSKIGKGLAILIHIMNPEMIILSGRGASVGKILIAPVQQALNRYCIPRLAAYTELCISEIGSNAELIGTAVLVMENFDKERKIEKKQKLAS